MKKMDKETYDKFWKVRNKPSLTRSTYPFFSLRSSSISTNLKLGVVEDFTNKSRIAKLLRFQSSNDPESLTSLDEYIERMKEKQEHIYFMFATSRKEVGVVMTSSLCYL